MTLMSSHEFNQDAGRARKLAETEPVFIIDHGEASHVLLSIRDYRTLASRRSMSDLLTAEREVDFDPSVIEGGDFRPMEFD